MKAVIIDDEKAAALDLARRLEAYPDINVVGTAQGGVEGLELLAKHNPDVLFLDIEMPDLSGIDFLERMDRQSNGRCKVVMFSAHDKYMLSAFRNQAFDFLMKPIDDADLRTVLQRVYASRKYEPTPIVQPTQDEKFLMYTGAADFRLVNLRDIGVFQYNSSQRVWEAVLADIDQPVHLKRTVNSDSLLTASTDFIQVHQKYIINMTYLIEVTGNQCHFFPPFDNIDYVKVGRLYRRKLIERFSCL